MMLIMLSYYAPCVLLLKNIYLSEMYSLSYLSSLGI